MSLLSRDQQIQVIGCLTEGMSIRAVERLTGIHRDTIMRLGARVGRCPYRKSIPDVLMMQSSEERLGDDAADGLDCPRNWRILVQ